MEEGKKKQLNMNQINIIPGKKNRHPDNLLPKSGLKKRRQTDKTDSNQSKKQANFCFDILS